MGSDADAERTSFKGLFTLLRSIGLRVAPEAKLALEHKACSLGGVVLALQAVALGSGFYHERDQVPAIDFPDFLRLMRWMLDTNFADINTTTKDWLRIWKSCPKLGPLLFHQRL